jgi:hypothetical protein
MTLEMAMYQTAVYLVPLNYQLEALERETRSNEENS